MKKAMFFAVVIALFALASTATAQTIQGGKFKADYNSAGWSLHENEGFRSFSIDIVFKKSFEKRPEIVLSTTMLDTDQKYPTRYKIEAKAVSSEGFLLEVTTWGDSRVNAIEGNWIAFVN